MKGFRLRFVCAAPAHAHAHVAAAVPSRVPGTRATTMKMKMPTGKKRFPKGFGLKTARKVVLDGANLCWSYGREKVKEQGSGIQEVPDIEGLRVALSNRLWDDLGVEPVVFLPTTCERYLNWNRYECSLDQELLFAAHRLVCVENGCIAQSIKCRINNNSSSSSSSSSSGGSGGGKGTQTSLRHKFQRANSSSPSSSAHNSKSVRRKRKAPSDGSSIKSRDDILLLRFAQKHNAWVLSNDKFRDHSAIHRRGWAGWLSERRLGFEFLRQEEENTTADGCGCGGFELKIVGNGQWEKFVAFRSSQMNELM